MDHRLVIEHRDGCYQARCSCDRWTEPPVALQVCRLREVYDRLDDAHHCHVQSVRGAVLPLAADSG